MNLLAVKIITMVLLGGVSLLLGIFPLFFRGCLNKRSNTNSKTDIFISCLNCFGGGVILTTCLTHMLPEVNYFLQINIDNGHFPDTGMPVAEILVLCGFFMIYVVEEITHLCIHKCCNDDPVAQTHEITPMMDMGHHQGDNVNVQQKSSSFEASLRGFLVILALSLHAVFEGIALGLTHTVRSVWFLFFAIASHKFVISFCIGMQFVTSGLSTCMTTLYVSTFALISPIGAGIGIALSETVKSEAALQNDLVTILQGLATGTLLYVVFFEIIEKEKEKGTNGFLQVTFLIIGFVCMILLEMVELQSAGSDSSDHGQNICEMRDFNLAWKIPMNFTCKEGVLVPQ